MKKLLLALALILVPSLASAQCSGVFPANTVCGATTQAPPKPIASTSLPTNIVVNSTTISGGTSLRVLYDNVGTVGEYTAAQVTALINLATSSLQGALPAWPNNTTTFFRGDGTYATLSCAALTNASALCSSTNAANLTGTLGTAQLPAFGSGDVSFATAGGAGTIANNAVTNAKAAQAPLNTMKGNWSSSTANVADNTMPSCADTSGNHLNYVNGTGITCGNTAAGSGLVLLATLTASNSATLSDATACSGSNCLTSTYSSYQLVFSNFIPANNERILQLQLHSGGAYKATGYLTQYAGVTGATAFYYATVTTDIPLTNPTATASIALGNFSPGFSGTVTIYNPSGSGIAQVVGVISYVTGSGLVASATISGWWNTAGVVDGFQVLMDSGNITSGVIKIYGVL